jgi:hypothetical protein
MTNLPPPDPQSSQRAALGFDEFIGILVAFTAIGTIFFWSLSKRDQGFQLNRVLPLLSPSPSAQPSPTPPSEATASPTPVSPLFPPIVPTESSPVLTPAPSRTPVRAGVSTAVIPVPTKSPTTARTQPIEFLDVPDDFWGRPFIDALSQRGVITGFPGRYFQPTRPVTRAEFATLLQETFNPNPLQVAAGYKDVPSAFWANPAIELATKAGFLKGYPGDVFLPQQEISKAQLLVALASGLNLAPKSPPSGTLQIYQDADQIPNYAAEKIAAATEAGLVVNYPNPQFLEPNRTASRAEVAAIMHQALVQAGKADPIQSQYVVRLSP